MRFLMKCLNEERAVKRVIGDFHDEPWVDDIIVIDGNSSDFTVHELLKFEKVKVFVHPWLHWYHAMEVSQSNIALSYVPNGEWCMILDFDERMSPELKSWLSNFNENERNNPGHMAPIDLINFSRRTFELMRHEDSPFCMYEEDGWPVISHQIHQYPDYQPRLIRKMPGIHWINSPHHVLFGYREQTSVQADILHFEKDDARDRERIEKQWASNKARRLELGLFPDKFEAVKQGFEQFTEPDHWRDYWCKKGA